MKRPCTLLLVSSASLSFACPPAGDPSTPEAPGSSSSDASTQPPTSAPTTGATTPAAPDGASTSSTSGPPDPGGTASTTGGPDEDDESSASATTTGEPLRNCGDGELDLGEQCDHGAANDDHGACTVECKLATCGDELTWQGHEDCDNGPDNNDNLYGGCTTKCQFGPRCNDGVVQGPEECDLGEHNGSGESPADSVPCDDGCRFLARLAFLTSETYLGGELGGVEGADIKCRTLAGLAEFDNANNFKAWLSDSQHSPAQDFTKNAALPLVRPDGVRIADNWNDLVLAGPSAPIAVTDKGDTVLDEYVWTGTTPSGKLFDVDMTCKTWSVSSASHSGWIGLSGVENQQDWTEWSNERHWTNFDSDFCLWQYHLYCFEQ